MGFLDTPGYARGVAVSGEHAFVADATGGLRALDVSVPSAPLEIGFVDTPGNAMGVAVANNVAYVADSWGGLRLIDVSVPSAPVEVGSLQAPDSYPINVILVGDNAFVVDGHGLRVIDISSPSAPVELGFAATVGSVDVAVEGHSAFVASGSAGVTVLHLLARSIFADGFESGLTSSWSAAVGGGP